MGSLYQAKNGDGAVILPGNSCFHNPMPIVLQLMFKISQVNTSIR